MSTADGCGALRGERDSLLARVGAGCATSPDAEYGRIAARMWANEKLSKGPLVSVNAWAGCVHTRGMLNGECTWLMSFVDLVLTVLYPCCARALVAWFPSGGEAL